MNRRRRQQGLRQRRPEARNSARLQALRRKGLFLWGSAIALIGAIAVIALYTLAGGPEDGKGSPRELAADIVLGTSDGQIRLSDIKGQPILLYFSFPG